MKNQYFKNWKKTNKMGKRQGEELKEMSYAYTLKTIKP